MANPFFAMTNNHVESCGVPPRINNEESGKYFGYFENEHGEQWVFIYDRAEKTAELHGGDIQWNNVQRVENGQVAGLILGKAELTWLQACWKAATAFGD